MVSDEDRAKYSLVQRLGLPSHWVLRGPSSKSYYFLGIGIVLWLRRDQGQFRLICVASSLYLRRVPQQAVKKITVRFHRTIRRRICRFTNRSKSDKGTEMGT